MAAPRFAVFDIDGTLIRWQLYHAVVDALARQGDIDQQAYQNIRQARMLWKKRTHQDSFREYEMELVKTYESTLKQLSVDKFDQALRNVFEEYKDQVYTYTRGLIRDLKDKGYLLFALSGSQQEIISLLAEHYGFDDWVGSRAEQVDGRFTGNIKTSLGRKPDILRELVARHQATYSGSIAVGDSEGDIGMLELTERPIAFNPSKKLFQHAREQGWKVVVERKNVVYELVSEDGSYRLKD